MTQEDWIRRFTDLGAFWMHDGAKERPHALLTSGKHSNGFFNGEIVLQDPVLVEEIAEALVAKLAQQRVDLSKVDTVAGPALGAITLAPDLARVISKTTGKPCNRVFAEKVGADQTEEMVFKRTAPRPGSLVLTCEDTVTTARSLELMHSAIAKCGAQIVPVAAMIVNRSGKPVINGTRMVSLVERDLPIWEPESCPLCEAGSEAIRPKAGDHWARLNANY